MPPIDQWAPEDAEAHVVFRHHVSELLEKNAEYVAVQALMPARTFVRYGGPDTGGLSFGKSVLPWPASGLGVSHEFASWRRGGRCAE